MTTKYLERRAFEAGYARGRYSIYGDQMSPGSLVKIEEDWREYASQPVQLELDFTNNPFKEEAPNEQNGRV